jgi:hypothetical protein
MTGDITTSTPPNEAQPFPRISEALLLTIRQTAYSLFGLVILKPRILRLKSLP